MSHYQITPFGIVFSVAGVSAGTHSYTFTQHHWTSDVCVKDARRSQEASHTKEAGIWMHDI